MPPRPPRTAAQQQRDIPMMDLSNTIQKKKQRAEAIKAARDKYSQLSRAALPPPTTTVPVDRPSTSRLRAPSASALPQFRADPAAAAAIRAGPQSTAAAMTSRPTATARPSLATRPSSVPTRPSVVPRPSLMARSHMAPRPSMLPRDPDAPFSFNNSAASSSSMASRGPAPSSPFQSMGESLSRILRNEQLPMAPGARASSIARRNLPRPSMVPGGINIFTATGAERVEAERLQAERLQRETPARRGMGDESVHRSRVRFEVVESILEQRESVGDEVEETASSSAATSSLSTLTMQSTLRREHSTLMGPLQSSSRGVVPSSLDPPRSILKQRRSPRVVVPSFSSPSPPSVAATSSSTSPIAPPTPIPEAEPPVADENRPARETLSGRRATPARSGGISKKSKKNQGMMDVFAILNRMSDEERRETPPEMIEACEELLRKMREKNREEQEEEGETEEEEESVLDRGIVVEDEEEEEKEEAEETMALPPCDLTIGGTPRRRSSRLAGRQGSVARSLFSD